METVTIKNLKALGKFAGKFARTLRGGDIVGLVGDLGAGKTTFVQHLAAAYGLKKPVRSPTFILLQELKLPAMVAKKTGIKMLVHIDAYRLESEKELFAIGFEDYAVRRDVVILIEWADRIPSVTWLDHYHEVKFSFGEDGNRILSLKDGLNRN